jgi:hypothetical protein
MELDDFLVKINREIDSGDFSLQAVFNRNIKLITKFKEQGYSYKTIFKKLNSRLKESHFRDLIWRANIHKNKKTESQNNIEEIPDVILTPNSAVAIKSETEEISNNESVIKKTGRHEFSFNLTPDTNKKKNNCTIKFRRDSK